MLVHSFTEVLQAQQTVNLQLFHRDGADAPTLPRLPALLDWPAAPLLDGVDGSGGVRCDMATRVSRRGALTWWHLDDGGEFVLQVHSIALAWLVLQMQRLQLRRARVCAVLYNAPHSASSSSGARFARRMSQKRDAAPACR